MGVGLYYGIPATIVLAGAIMAVRVRLRHLPRIGRTTGWMSVLLPVTALAITPVTMAYAWTTGYNTAAMVVLSEAGLVLAALAGATALGRRLALREPETPAPHLAGIGPA